MKNLILLLTITLSFNLFAEQEVMPHTESISLIFSNEKVKAKFKDNYIGNISFQGHPLYDDIMSPNRVLLGWQYRVFVNHTLKNNAYTHCKSSFFIRIEREGTNQPFKSDLLDKVIHTSCGE